MKLAIRIALSLSLIFPGSVFAKGDAAMRSPTLQDKDAFFATAERVLNAKRGSNLATFNREKMRKTIKEGQRQALAAPAKSLAHMSQTFVLLWILGGIEAVKQDRKLSPLQNKAHSKLSLVADAGDHMINSFDLFASMALASATSAVMAGPVNALQQLISSNVTRPLLKNLLNGGAASLVAFLGWESGAKLWEEAILLLDSGEEIKTAKNMRMIDVMRGRGTPQEREVYRKVFYNAYSILVWDQPEVTKIWIFNTWRHRILTGEFVTMITSMVTAGAVAGSLAPGAGTLVGICFGFVGGLVGGVIAISLPHSWKQSITDGIRDHRIWAGRNGLRLVDRWMKRDFNGNRFPIDHQRERLKLHLASRYDSRNAILTAQFEQIYDAFLRFQEAEAVLKLINKHRMINWAKTLHLEKFFATLNESDIETESVPVRELEIEFRAQYDHARQTVHHYFNDLLELQKSEATVLGQLAYSPEVHPEIQDELTQILNEQTSLHMQFRYMFAGLMPEMYQQLMLPQLSLDDFRLNRVSSLIMLNYFYANSMDEAALTSEE